MKRHIAVLALVVTAVSGPAIAAGEASRTFAAPADRVWAVTHVVLRHLGWDVDKDDRAIGWITTNSRKVAGEDYGVYARATRHRLRIIIKDAGAGKSSVTVERTLFKRERILFIDNDEILSTSDRSVEQSILVAIGKAL